MKAMLWKEFREVGTWAVLALVVIGVCNAFGCYNLRDSLGDSRNTLWLTRVDMLPFSSIVLGPVAGILIGMVQILPELRRDQWAFLVHRPLSSANLFWGKAVPGLLMVLVVIILPDLLAFLWLRSRLPFPELLRWELLQSSFGAVLSGMMFYFAAMLSALRPVRWYGSRLLGLPAALILTIGCIQAPQFSQALLISVAGTAFLALAAWGCFANRGDYRALPVLSKVALATILLIGAGSVASAGIGLVSILLNARWENRQLLLSQEWWHERRVNYLVQRVSYRLDTQGRVMAVQLAQKDKQAIFEVRGRTIPEDKVVAFAPTEKPNQYFRPFIPLLLGGAARGVQNTSREASERSYMSVRSIYSLLYENRDQICLYNLLERRIVYYDKKERRITGYLGPVGYYPAQGPVPSQGAFFPSKLLSNPMGPIYWYKHSVFWVEPQARKVSRIIHTPSAEPILNVVPVQGGNFNAQPTQGLLELFLVTPGDIRVLNRSGQEIARTTINQGVRDLSIHVTTVSSPKRIYWLAEIDRNLAGHHSLRSLILETTGNGQVERRFSLPKFQIDRSDSSPPGSILTAMVLPAWPQSDYEWLPLSAESEWNSTIFNYELRSLTPAVPVLFPLGMAILCTLAMFFLTRNFGVDRLERWFWIMLALPLGPVALLGLVSVRSQPSRLPCPECQKPRLVQRKLCAHCGSGWNIPPHDGTEIFVEKFGVERIDVKQLDSQRLATGGMA